MRSRSCPSRLLDNGPYPLVRPDSLWSCSQHVHNNASCNKRCQEKICPKNATCNNLLSTRELSAVDGPVSQMAERRRCGGTTIKPTGCDSARANSSIFSIGRANQPVVRGCKRAGIKEVTPGRTCSGVARVASCRTGSAGRWPSIARSTGHTKTSKPTKAAHGDPGSPTMSVCAQRATVTLRPGLVATPRNTISAPMAAMARAAKS